MNIKLQYGPETVLLDLGEGARVQWVEPEEIKSAPAEGLIRSALEKPLGTPPLAEIVRGKERVVLVVSDKTRATGASLFLPILLETLSRVGISDETITIVLATGDHIGHTPEQMDQVLGPGIASRFRVIDHDSDDAASHVTVGTTGGGTEVSFQREVVESDCLILTGGITFHYFAGFGGGRKSLLPGVASHDTIVANHRLMVVDGRPEDAIHPKVANGILDGNPVHEDMVEAARLAEPAFVLNTILAPDGAIADVVAGDLWKVHEAGVRKVRSLYGVPVRGRAKLVVASCGGHPKDLNYIQTHKSFHHAFDLVAEDGVLILLGQCSEGIGSDDFLLWFENLDLSSVGERLCQDFTINAHTAYVSMRKALSRKVVFLTDLPDEMVRKMGMIPAESPEAAVNLAKEALGTIEDALVLPKASITVPQLERRVTE